MTQLASPYSPRLAELFGSERVVTNPAELAGYEIDGHRPSAVLRPADAASVGEILRFASAERLAVIPTGGRTKLAIGMPPRRYDLALDLSAMNRVLAYDPQDLTLGVEPGVRFADMDRQLREKGQFLPPAPAFAERATIGGIVAAAADTPFRYGYGTIRDYLLGLEFVTGEGTASKSGGRVVKNVTGYDLHKLMIGSLGTLAVITRLNFRTFPLPAEKQMFVTSFSAMAPAFEMCGAIAKSPLQPRLVDVVDPGTARLFAAHSSAHAAAHVSQDRWSVIAETSGHKAVVERHARDLKIIASQLDATEFTELDEARRTDLFACLCEFPRIVLEAHRGAAIFRIAALPSVIPKIVEQAGALGARHALGTAALIRATGIVHLCLAPDHGDQGTSARLVAACRELMLKCSEMGVRPMIEWCPEEVKRQVGVWPLPGDEQKIAERLKKIFDPQGILSPGRFQGGI
jgi:glycolate oxidase FAD binding subunit